MIYNTASIDSDNYSDPLRYHSNIFIKKIDLGKSLNIEIEQDNFDFVDSTNFLPYVTDT